MIKSALAEALEIIGDKPARTVSKEDVRGYRLTLGKLPAHLGVRYAGRSIAEVLAERESAESRLAAENPTPGLSASTIRKRMSYLISLFKYAERMEWVDKNPADGMRPPKAKKVYAERDAFTDEDLRAIFGSDYKAATLGAGNAARYWIPLVLLYTGARLEEIAQLETADVAEVQGIPCVKIAAASSADAPAEPGEGKSLKTAGSDRTVPIHSGLVALGFLDYVEERRRAGDRRLFPRLQRQRNRGYGVVIGQWFTRWERSHGIASNRKVLHSLRHTFATRLKEADVQEHTIAELLGHEVESITTGRYGKPLGVDKLRQAVGRLEVGEGLRDL